VSLRSRIFYTEDIDEAAEREDGRRDGATRRTDRKPNPRNDFARMNVLLEERSGPASRLVL
jgi:hypothetical protein